MENDKILFQSPSLRGSGRFALDIPQCCEVFRKFQSPSLRGSGRFEEDRKSPRGCRGVSIPFIAGQWSLQLPLAMVRADMSRFQSPSLRGSGRFGASASATGSPTRCFNPLHCGAVVASAPIAPKSAFQT